MGIESLCVCVCVGGGGGGVERDKSFKIDLPSSGKCSALKGENCDCNMCMFVLYRFYHYLYDKKIKKKKNKKK